MESRTRFFLSLIFNFMIAVIGSTGVCLMIFVPDIAGVSEISSGANAFRYFTVDGNIVCAVSGAVATCCLLMGYHYNKLAFYLKYMSAVTSAIILIVALAMIPFMGSEIYTGASMIMLHFVNPALCIISFIFLDARWRETRKTVALISLLPVFIYGIVAIILCLEKVWTGDMIPYPFMDFYNNPEWVSILCVDAIFIGSVIIAVLFDKLNIYVAAKTDDIKGFKS